MKRRQYTEEYKEEAVRLALESGKPKAQVARELGLNENLLYKWIDKHEHARANGLSVPAYNKEQEELRRLQAQVKQLKLENEILKKAAAYFAKEQL